MGWGDLWSLLLQRFAAEAIQLRILIGLAAAFLALMIVEGLRASFRPVRNACTCRTAVEPAGAFVPKPRPAPKAPPAAKTSPVQPFRARTTVSRAVPKPAKGAVSAHRTPRPLIRRAQVGLALPPSRKPAPNRLSPNC